MKKLTCSTALFLLLVLSGGVAHAQVDLTSPESVRALGAGSGCATKIDIANLVRGIKLEPYEHADGRTIAPFRPPPNVSPEEGNGCWTYGSDSNYHYGPTCYSSPYGCIQNCITKEQQCAQNAWQGCQSLPTQTQRDVCVENAQDPCRTQRQSCDAKCD